MKYNRNPKKVKNHWSLVYIQYMVVVIKDIDYILTDCNDALIVRCAALHVS
jgi:hypothetical protein